MDNETRKRHKSLFVRYFMATILTLIFSFVILGVLLMAFFANFWTENNVSTLKSNVIRISEITQTFYESDTFSNDSETSDLFLANMMNVASNAISADVFMCDAEGNIILCKDAIDSNLHITDGGTCKKHSNITIPKRILSQTDSDGYYTMDKMTGIYDRLTMVVGSTIEINGNVVGYVYATTSVKDGLEPFMAGMMNMFGVAVIITFIVAAIGTYIFSYGLTKPLKDMAELTDSYGKGDFSKRIETDDSSELGDLARELNKMAESLEGLEESRRSFVANVSHELKTPMTTISGFIDGIQDGTIKKKDQDRYLNIIGIEVKRLSRLVVAMMSLSKIEAGEEELKKSEIDLPQMMFTILLNFEPMISKHSINVKGFEDMPHVHLEADEDMLYQVIYNLFDNAVKFTPGGGTISVSAKEENNRVYVVIKNTGKGIPPAEAEKVFDRFYKVDKSRSEDVKGVGLGLNLVKKIIVLHKGEVYVESEVGEYTKFTFWLPKQ